MVQARRFVLGMMVVGTLGACSTGVLHGLDEATANESLTTLEQAGIGAEKVAEENNGATPAFGLQVPRGEAGHALDVLHARGLPRERRQGFAEVYGQPSLIPTASEERARYLRATAAELERTLETADGIVSARVHLVVEDPDPLALETKPRTGARAAVLIKTAPRRSPLTEADIQKLVAGGVPGLEPQAVAVVSILAPAAPETRSGALAAIGPFRVTPASRGPLIAVFAVALATIGVLGALLFVTLRRRS
ncbi:MAG TPA: secretion protein [Polyangia bacterium]|nr:secretion protein [Polyangia bacterium]